jgi:hypothetical protein
MKFFLYIDFLGPEAKLNTFSNARYKTLTGGIISIMTFITLLLISGYFVLQTFLRTKMTLNYNEEFNVTPYYNFSASPLFFMMMSDTAFPVDNENFSVFSVSAVYGEFFYTSGTLNFSNMTLVNCSTLDPSIQNIYNPLFISYGYCFDFPGKDAILYGKYGTVSDFGYINIYINECVNQTDGLGTICMPKEVIDQNLNRAVISLLNVDYILNSGNFSTPRLAYPNSNNLIVSNTMVKLYTVSFQNIEYVTDIGFVFQEENEIFFSTLDSIVETSDLSFGADGNFVSITLTNTNYKSSYNRSYLKIQNLLADIGGVVKVLMIVASFIERYFTSIFWWASIGNTIFNVNLKNEENLKNNISKNNISNSKLQLNAKGTSKMIENNFVNEYIFFKFSNLENQINLPITRNVNENIYKKFNKQKQMIKPNFKDMICPRILNKSKIANAVNRIETYVANQISVENLINKVHEIEKIKFLLMDDNELLAFKYLSNPNLIVEIVPNEKDRIQELWNKTRIINTNQKNEIEAIKNSFNNENISKELKRIITLF